MSYLRFAPQEYDVLARVGRALSPDRHPPYVFRRMLVAALGEVLPALGQRIAALRRRELLLLCNHLRARQPSAEVHDLTADELQVLIAAGGPLLFNARFSRVLRRALVEQFCDMHPGLAAKLECMSLHQFERLCEQVR